MSTNNYLFDTTYLLPFFGIEINLQGLTNELQSILDQNKINLFITSISLLEAKWVAIRNYRNTKDPQHLERANEAIEGFYSQKHFIVLDPLKSVETMLIADNIYTQGHKDYMDCLIAATAIEKEFNFITEDKNLKDIVEHLFDARIKIKSWKNFVKIIF